MVQLSDVSLRLDLQHYLCFLYPSKPPTDDTVITGELIVNVRAAKKIKRLSVEFIGRQKLLILGQLDEYETVHNTIDISPGQLQPGEHRFEFSFVVSANTAPWELCYYGGTQHYLKATAYGAGLFGSDVSITREIDVASNTAGDVGPSEGFSEISESLHDVLGPLRVHFSTRYLLRGGYLRMALNMPSVSKNVRIDNISAVLKQDTILQNIKKPERTERKTQDITLWSLSQENSQPTELKEGEDLSLVRQMRLQTSRDERVLLRPSINENSVTGIRHTHTIMVVIRFRAQDDNNTREMKIKFPANIGSCACSVENLQLPNYESTSGSAQEKSKSIEQLRSECLCHRPSDEELDKIYASDPEAVNFDDQYGAEKSRRPAWMIKAEDTQGQEYMDDLMRR